jgi:hypothetical protein
MQAMIRHCGHGIWNQDIFSEAETAFYASEADFSIVEKTAGEAPAELM